MCGFFAKILKNHDLYILRHIIFLHQTCGVAKPLNRGCGVADVFCGVVEALYGVVELFFGVTESHCGVAEPLCSVSKLPPIKSGVAETLYKKILVW